MVGLLTDYKEFGDSCYDEKKSFKFVIEGLHSCLNDIRH